MEKKMADSKAIPHKKVKRAKLQQSTLTTTKEANEARAWFEIDATGKTLGRLASELTRILRGKHRTAYTPHIDCGDGVVVVVDGFWSDLLVQCWSHSTKFLFLR